MDKLHGTEDCHSSTVMTYKVFCLTLCVEPWSVFNPGVLSQFQATPRSADGGDASFACLKYEERLAA